MKNCHLVLNHDPECSVLLVATNCLHQTRQAVGVAVDIEVEDPRSDQIGSIGGLHNAYPNQDYSLKKNNYPENNRIGQGIAWRMIARQLEVIF